MLFEYNIPKHNPVQTHSSVLPLIIMLSNFAFLFLLLLGLSQHYNCNQHSTEVTDNQPGDFKNFCREPSLSLLVKSVISLKRQRAFPPFFVAIFATIEENLPYLNHIIRK